jgi:hypothetical protein
MRIVGMLVDLETAADQISMCEPGRDAGPVADLGLCAGHLRGRPPRLSSEDIERLVTVRTQRQHGVFLGLVKAKIHAVLNEAILARRVGGPAVAEAQLAHVRDLAASGSVDVHVLTYDSAAHASMRGIRPSDLRSGHGASVL